MRKDHRAALIALVAGSAALAVTAAVARPPVAPQVDVASVNPGSTIERSLCLAVDLGNSVLAECGDLRVVHPLPATRTFNTERQPVLTYNSQHAHPYPYVQANVTLPVGGDVPDSVTAAITVNSVERTRRKWAGNLWSAGATRRIGLGFDAINDSTGVYAYTMTVTNWYATTPYPTVTNGEYAIVNRANSYFGAGWWPAGLEMLYKSTMTWVGGDGSIRKFASVGPGVWVAPSLDHPDTIRTSGPWFVRRVKGGARVKFDTLGGTHRFTMPPDTVHQTEFTYASNRLATIKLPVPSGAAARTYTFAYSGNFLQTVTAPPIGATTRITTATITSGRITSLQEPDTRTVGFGYDAGFAHRMTTRTNRRGVTTTFSYDGANRLSQSSLSMGAAPAIVNVLRSIETQITSPNTKDPAQLYSLVNGPRTDVGDSTRFWLDRWGAPVKIRNALNDSTIITRGNVNFPGVVTFVRQPNGQKLSATYNTRGNPTALVDSSTFIGGLYATTNVTYGNTSCPDFPTVVRPPQGNSTTFTYNSATCSIASHYDARGASYAIAYQYYGSATAGQGLVGRIKPPQAGRDSLIYDAYGNLKEVWSPTNLKSSWQRDSIGRATLVVTPFNNAQTRFRRDQYIYDVMSRLTAVETRTDTLKYNFGAGTVTIPADTLTVTNAYDAEGNLTEVLRSQERGGSLLYSIVTTWTYDNADRPIKEIGTGTDTTGYDPAGNPTWRRTPRGDTITMKYDALNRLTHRELRQVTYTQTTCTPHVNPPCTYRFPIYPNDGGTGLVIAADTAVFTYDAMGNLRTANNREARIARTWNLNGTLAADTLRIRKYSTLNDFSQHVYGIRHGYDRNGRRIWTKHPANLAPASGKDSVAYRYASWGPLDQVRSVMGNLYNFTYDNDARLARVTLPGSVKDTLRYDAESRVYWRTVTGSQSVISDSLTFDPRAKILTAKEYFAGGSVRTMTNFYTGVGIIAASRDSRTSPSELTVEEFVADALGNVHEKAKTAASTNGLRLREFFTYSDGQQLESESEILLQNGPWPDSSYAVYDGGGNVRHSGQRQYVRSGTTFTLTTTAPMSQWYGADEKLRYVQRYLYTGSGLNTQDGAWQEIRYDALGRRVLMRTRLDSLCNSNCSPAIERYVWDGDVLLYELKAQGGDNLTPTQLETAWSTGTYYGKIAYTNGLGVDRPLDVIKDVTVLVPHLNWRGLYGEATDTLGRRHCSGAPAPCTGIRWPGRLYRTYLDEDQLSVPRSDYWGSVIQEQRDASGLLYRRNRYYDPERMVFAQEDPIGLGGGLNLYGFADGDPVNFSDPFGLMACPPCEEEEPLRGAPPLMIPGGSGLLGAAARGGRFVQALVRTGGSLRVATAAARMPSQFGLAARVAKATGGRLSVSGTGRGFSVTVPQEGGRSMVLRVMAEGGGRQNYWRLSVEGKQAFTQMGGASSDPALTHISIGRSSFDDIMRIIRP